MDNLLEILRGLANNDMINLHSSRLHAGGQDEYVKVLRKRLAKLIFQIRNTPGSTSEERQALIEKMKLRFRSKINKTPWNLY